MHGVLKQEYWSRFYASSKDLPDPGIELVSLHLLHCRILDHYRPLGKPRRLSKRESDERKMFSEGQEQGDKELFPFVEVAAL